MERQLVRKKQYVYVQADFDATGFMRPRSISWSDGRDFRIDALVDYHPAAVGSDHVGCDCYRVVICGQEKKLFFERKPLGADFIIGRWFVERIVMET